MLREREGGTGIVSGSEGERQIKEAERERGCRRSDKGFSEAACTFDKQV